MIKNICLGIVLVFMFNSCSKEVGLSGFLLSDYLEFNSIADDVIACAASDVKKQKIEVYFFPEINTTDYRLYLLDDQGIDKMDFSNYEYQFVDSNISIGNKLRSFKLDATQKETWAIVTFTQENKISYSTPINLKHKTSPTLYENHVEVDREILSFTWGDLVGADGVKNAIFFEVINDDENNLISGTYTLDNSYIYLDHANVVLTITPNNNQKLDKYKTYEFIVMGVGKDNWVNFISNKTF